jgi:hypothetical protein
MGLFEDIERAWFTVDNKLFLWDYDDGSVFTQSQAPTVGRLLTWTDETLAGMTSRQRPYKLSDW